MLHTARAQAAAVAAAMQRASGEGVHVAAWPALLRALQATAPSSAPPTPHLTSTRCRRTRLRRLPDLLCYGGSTAAQQVGMGSSSGLTWQGHAP